MIFEDETGFEERNASPLPSSDSSDDGYQPEKWKIWCKNWCFFIRIYWLNLLRFNPICTKDNYIHSTVSAGFFSQLLLLSSRCYTTGFVLQFEDGNPLLMNDTIGIEFSTFTAKLRRHWAKVVIQGRSHQVNLEQYLNSKSDIVKKTNKSLHSIPNFGRQISISISEEDLLSSFISKRNDLLKRNKFEISPYSSPSLVFGVLSCWYRRTRPQLWMLELTQWTEHQGKWGKCLQECHFESDDVRWWSILKWATKV